MSQTRPVPVPADWQTLPTHPLAELIEFGVSIDMDAIIDDMRKNGYDDRYPVVLFDGAILNGRHRRHCAKEAGVVPTFCVFIGDDPHREATEKILRQHLSISQRSMFAARLANLRNGETRAASQNNEAETRAEAARNLQVSTSSVDLARIVEDNGTESLKRAVRVGKVKVSDAAKVARKAQAVQDYAVEQVEQKKAKTVAEAATLCNRCHKRLTKDHKLPVEKCVKCADVRLNGKPKKPKKPKPAPALAAEPPAEQQELPALLEAIAFALADYIERAPLRFGQYTDPRQPELKTAAEGLVADLEDWTKGMAGDGTKEKLFDNQSRGGPRGYGR